jgi:hypothetical protein
LTASSSGLSDGVSAPVSANQEASPAWLLKLLNQKIMIETLPTLEGRIFSVFNEAGVKKY